jgi:hypothetical protein
MRQRPKPPSLVSMWMLDVFCCALGCVTLLWLLNNREATIQTQRAGSALQLLSETESELTRNRKELARLQQELEQTRLALNREIRQLQNKLVATVHERDETATKLALAEADLSQTREKLATASTRIEELDDLLLRKQRDLKELSAKLLASTTSSAELQKLLRQKEQERLDLVKKSQQVEEQLSDLDAKFRMARKEAAEATDALAAMRKAGDELAQVKAALEKTTKELTASRAAVQAMQSQLQQSAATIVDLQGEKAKLADKFDKLRIESDNKFAGIATTGKRVVFIVDMSGSMSLLDDKTPAPGKWDIVAETVGKVMKSIPELELFQVVLFSTEAFYLYSDGRWQKYQGPQTALQVTEQIKNITPKGDTNLYIAFDLAFRFRDQGLDTIYLFSDGLPTSGPGLEGIRADSLSYPEKSTILGNHLRNTIKTVWNPERRRPRVKINTIGFYFESPDLGAFLWSLARENEGSFVGMSRP